jgi:UrcA family protein
MTRNHRHQTHRRAAARLLTAVAGAALLASGSAFALGPGKEASERLPVSYADLDLAHEDGARALLGRIESAAERVCGTVSIREGVRRYQEARRCFDAAVDEAVRLVDSDQLERVHGS